MYFPVDLVGGQTKDAQLSGDGVKVVSRLVQQRLTWAVNRTRMGNPYVDKCPTWLGKMSRSIAVESPF